MTEADKTGVVRDSDADVHERASKSEGRTNSDRLASPSDRAPARRGLSDQTQLRLGNHLRTMYDAVLQQPVPDRFRDLIERLDSGKAGGR